MEYFGERAFEVLVDNQKVCGHLPPAWRRSTQFNDERFLDMAGHYGFAARACRPYRAWPDQGQG
ncbi:MAG: hypothetical protein U0411_15205 [Thermodesulfovibrionales bacterium]